MTDSSNTEIRDQFWLRPLAELSRQEWEMLCDGCARCCLKKLQDVDSLKVQFTRVACRYLNQNQCTCKAYKTRQFKVPDCLVLDMENLPSALHWIPETCAYKLRFLDRPLPDWHPLLTGNRTAMIEMGISITGRILSEDNVHENGLEEHVIRWVKA